MGFYEKISKYYDYIFPISSETVDFIKRTSGNPPKAILDAACGTGGYSLELEKHGYALTAVDIDKSMIEGLKQKAIAAGSHIEFLQAGMLDLERKLDEKMFDVVFCIGNSLVHLDNQNEISEFFFIAKSVLAPKGKLIIQTINYDRVISRDVRSLPTISNKSVGLSFERYYRYERDINKVMFKTILRVADKKIENEIPLYPVRYDDSIVMLKNAGFKNIFVYGGFDNSDFDKENSYMMVIEAM